MKARILKRKKEAHKGDFGHILVLAGSRGFSGAAYLCSQAAILSGAGLVTLGIPESLNTIMARKLTEVMTLPLPETKEGSLDITAFKKIMEFIPKIDVVAIGPGLSQYPKTQQLVRKLIRELDRPLVIDADGLNALAGHLELLKKKHSVKIITPHPGEMARLLGMKANDVQKARQLLAKNFSCRYNILTVLKGFGTVVADAQGKTYINTTGNPGMAKGGTGDILTGIIAAFLAQGLSAFKAAKLGVYVHGLAGDLAVKEKGEVSLLATDILEKLPQTLKKVCS